MYTSSRLGRSIVLATTVIHGALGAVSGPQKLADAIDNLSYGRGDIRSSMRTIIQELNHGADINTRTTMNNSPLSAVISTLTLYNLAPCYLIEVAQQLVARGACVDVVDETGFTPLQMLLCAVVELQKEDEAKAAIGLAHTLLNATQNKQALVGENVHDSKNPASVVFREKSYGALLAQDFLKKNYTF